VVHEIEVDVVVIGGGPVGLTAASLLGRLGVSTVLFERNPTTSFHPRGHIVNGRTMEIYRQLGFDEEVAAASLPVERHAGVEFVTSLAGEEIGSIRTRGDPDQDALERSLSPVLKRSCPQDVLEPILRRHAERYPSVSLRFGTEVTEVTQDDDAVQLNWKRDDGETGSLKTRYVIAADGARSPTRTALGIDMTGGSMGQQIGVYFKADLWPWIEDRPYVLWWIYNATTTGVLISLDGRFRWTYNFAYDETEPRDSFTTERCETIVRAVIGDPDVPIDIQSIMPWRMQARIAERMQVGRVFLAGDAAHPLPPTGGQGMNTGIADVHNLVWKLKLVLDGSATDALLGSYQTERLPAARFNVEQSVRNARKMADTGLTGILVNDREVMSKIEGPEGAQIRARLAGAIPEQREHFDNLGQTFGYVYESEFVVPDGTPAPPMSVHVYQATARPGHRAPHFWLDRDGGRISVLDLIKDSDFTLLAGRHGRAWVDAFTGLIAEHGLRGGAYCVGPGGELTDPHEQWLTLYGISEAGAVLVRPDGHVLWRSAGGSPDAQSTIEAALRAGIGLREERSTPNNPSSEKTRALSSA